MDGRDVEPDSRPFTVVEMVMRNHYSLARKWNYVQISMDGFREFPMVRP